MEVNFVMYAPFCPTDWREAAPLIASWRDLVALQLSGPLTVQAN